MSFAIYGESSGYVHLVSSTTRELAIHDFMSDIHSVGVSIKQVSNVYAVEGNREDKDLEDFIENMIKEASDD